MPLRTVSEARSVLSPSPPAASYNIGPSGELNTSAPQRKAHARVYRHQRLPNTWLHDNHNALGGCWHSYKNSRCANLFSQMSTSCSWRCKARKGDLRANDDCQVYQHLCCVRVPLLRRQHRCNHRSRSSDVLSRSCLSGFTPETT